MDELGFGKPADVEALEQRELLQRDRPGAPWARFADRRLAVLVRGNRFERRAPGGQIATLSRPPSASQKR
jgi:hypothetical protein